MASVSASLDTNSVPFATDPEIAQCIAETTETASHIYSAAKSAFNNLKVGSTSLYNYLQRQIEEIDIDAVNEKSKKSFADAEKIFNMAECLPVIGWLSGSIRTVLGQIQMISGIALTALSEIGKYMSSDKDNETPIKRKWDSLSKIGIEMTIHGSFNTIRGTITATIGGYTFGAGNLLLIVPNIINQRNFSAYYNY